MQAVTARRTTVKQIVPFLLSLAFLSVPVQGVQQPAALEDGVNGLLRRLERLLEAGDPAGYLALLSSTASERRAREFADTAFAPGVTRAVIRERDRTDLAGTLPGNGYRLLLDVLIESGPRARLSTWQLDVRRRGGSGGETAAQGTWLVAGQELVSTLYGLYKLALNPVRQFSARGLTIAAEDLQLSMAEGSVFTSEADGRVTALVLLGRGEMTFSPAPATERGQLRIFCGAEVLQTPFDAAFIRFSPGSLPRYIARGSLESQRLDARDLKRADEVFRQEVGKSFGVELGDLSPDGWSLMPSSGDVLAEVRTRRFDTLTYARSTGDPEDISLFNRKTHRNIAVYTSQEKFAARGRFYNEDDQSDYDVLDYDIDASFSPDREWVEGRALMHLRVREPLLQTLTFRLADSVTINSVFAPPWGRMLALRVRNQNSVVVNLPSPLMKDQELTLTVDYSGRLPPQPIDRESVAPQRGTDQDVLQLSIEDSYMYSNRSYWYPQGAVTGYATATLRLTVPTSYGCVASGNLTSSRPVPPTNAGKADVPRRQYVFVAPQPLRYLACLITPLVQVRSDVVRVEDAIRTGSVRRGPGVYYDSFELRVETNPRERNRGRQVSDQAADILRFYTSLVGDVPYPSLTLALVEQDRPGGHSPAYLAALSEPVIGSRLNWRGDPASFPDFPEFYIAHELAHQWWGQAVGWKNYHEQWLSEGFAQYFSALYAERARGREVFDSIIRRFRKWGIEESGAGPVYLGYRIGHIKGDSRLFRAIVYNKSAAVLHMLRRLVGDDAFFRGVRRFYDEMRFRKAGTDDLQRAFEEESGVPLARFFERWIYDDALPQVQFASRTEQGAQGPELVLRFDQTGQIFDLPVTVSIDYVDKPPVDVLVKITGSVSETRIPLAGQLRKVEVNRDEAALANFR
jgi:hypothetical protein